MNKPAFEVFAERTAKIAGSKYAFAAAVAVVLGWAITGPYFSYSDSWSLVINTLTTIITFWMGFLILNAQTRGERALHLKLDELIRTNEKARDELIGLELRAQDEIESLGGEHPA